MADDDDFIKGLMARYGHGYEPAGPGGDPNSLGYAIQGPAAPVDTANVMSALAARQAASEREGPEAAARLAMTLATGVGAAAGRRATYTPSPEAESVYDMIARYIKAMALHQRGEVKRGNPSGYLEGLGVLGGSTAAATAAALTGHPDLAALAASGMLMTRPGSVLMSGHTQDTKNIAEYLRALQLREAARAKIPAKHTEDSQ